ncbi:MAG: hypothetical protein HZC51_13390 [Nitrospirae bacterium]|nr:hypothetical protein [Nitrospirota bacterium]
MQKIGRKIYHMSGGLIMVAAYAALGRTSGLAFLGGLFLVATAIDVARLKTPAFNEFMYAHFSRFIRESEKDRLTGTPWYVLGVLLAAALYDLPVAAYAVAFLACGDVAATTVGERWGTIKISGVKSLQGTLAFIVVASLVGFLISRVFYPVSPAVFLVGALVAAMVEILPLKLDDNLTVPVVSGAVMQAMIASGF